MITPNQIREKRISTAPDGYDRNEVNELLVEVIESYEAVCAENKELYRKMEILANKIEEYREDEDSIKTAIISAQKTAHQVTKEAKELAEKTISESNASAQQTVKDAKEKADKIIGEAREYVSNLTQEKTAIAEQIVSEARQKANAAISSAKLVADDTIEKAKAVTEKMISDAKAERSQNEKLLAMLKAEAGEFKTTLVGLYETQLNKLKGIAQPTDEPQTAQELENELGSIISAIDDVDIEELVKTEPVEENQEVEPEIEPEEESADEPEVIELVDADEPEDTEESAQTEPESPLFSIDEEIDEIDEVDEIINEIESNEPSFEPIEEDEPEMPTEEEIASAINAFTQDEITPVEGTGATIPVIDEEPEFEAMPFESFFNVGKTDVNTNETISLTSPDEDEEEDTSRFKGFFKKKK